MTLLLRGGSDAAVGPAISPAVSPRDAGLNAAAPIVKTTNLTVSVANAIYHNCSLIALVEANGFKSAIAIVYGYNNGHSHGPPGRS